MEPEGSLPHLEVPATCPYPEPDQCSLFLFHRLGHTNGSVQLPKHMFQFLTPLKTKRRLLYLTL